MKTTNLLVAALLAATSGAAFAQAASQPLPTDAATASQVPASAGQSGDDAAPSVNSSAVTTQTTAPAAVPTCELHVYPTLEGQAQSSGWLSGLGIIGAVADAASNANRNVSDAEYLRDALGPRFQVSAFQAIDLPGALHLPAGTQVFFEQPIADRDITTEVRTRLIQNNSAACYAELIVTQNLYIKRPIYGRSLNNRFIFKDFRNGVTQAMMVRGRGGNGLSQFPPETPDAREAADVDLRRAFLANFAEYAARFH